MKAKVVTHYGNYYLNFDEHPGIDLSGFYVYSDEGVQVAALMHVYDRQYALMPVGSASRSALWNLTKGAGVVATYDPQLTRVYLRGRHPVGNP